MKKLFLPLIYVVFFSFLFTSCDKDEPVYDDTLIIAMPSDVESLNPLYSFSANEGNISELIYSGLVYNEWNAETGEIESFPMLAEKWEWSEDSSSITVYLREGVTWTDGEPFTAEDVVYTFDMYSDPDVESRNFGTFDYFYTEDDLSIDLEKTFEIIDPIILKINFKEGSVPEITDIDFPIIPKHTFAEFERKDFFTIEKGLDSVNIGPYKFGKWDKNQAITLKINEESFLYSPDRFKKIIFKIVPDYNSRLTQLKKGEVDFMEDVQTNDALELKDRKDLIVDPVKGRIYDYIGWMNIDHDFYEKTEELKPNKLFGDDNVRKALTYAINREEILNEYLYNYGELAVSPIAPIFKSAYNNELVPYEYNPNKAKELLNTAGWNDYDKDGILEKGDIEFVFTLYISSDNPRREYAASIVKNNLNAVGVKVNIEKLELGVFIEKMFAMEFDAWMSGWLVPVPYPIKTYWGSNFDESFLNNSGFNNNRVDEIVVELEKTKNPVKKNNLLKEFQAIIHKNVPVTFLYWVDNLTCYNTSIDNIEITPLGALHNCWEWTVSGQ